MKENLESMCARLRGEIRDMGERVKALLKHDEFKGEQAFLGQHDEMIANIMLSFRHLEDARMRIGKVMQQIQLGKQKPENEG